MISNHARSTTPTPLRVVAVSLFLKKMSSLRSAALSFLFGAAGTIDAAPFHFSQVLVDGLFAGLVVVEEVVDRQAHQGGVGLTDLVIFGGTVEGLGDDMLTGLAAILELVAQLGV